MSQRNEPVIVGCPGSKSMTQRALIIAALARDPVTIEGALVCDDSRYLSDVLRALGVEVEWREDGAVDVTPAPLHAAEQVLFVGNAGTAMRFASCLSLVTEGELTLDGDERMRERPIAALVDALCSMGVAARYLGRSGCPPVALRRGSTAGSEVELDVSLSSQYASGLLLVAPRLNDGLRLRLRGEKVSLPYLQMTTEMMQRAAAQVSWTSAEEIHVASSQYSARRIAVEPDWSTAAFLLGAAEIARREAILPGLAPPGKSLQGDSAFVSLLEELRQPRAHRIDLRHTPDLIAPLAAVALFASHPTAIRGVPHARVKECDRIAVLSRELAKLGAEIHEHPDGLEIAPLDLARRDPAARLELEPENDHRMAMAFGLASLRVPGIVVRDRECVSKSFPDFWAQLERFKTTGRR